MIDLKKSFLYLTLLLSLYANGVLLPVAQAAITNSYFVPSSSNENQQGFVRFTNKNSVDVNVYVTGIDDSGTVSTSTITFTVPANGSVQINSDDIEYGNEPKGISGSFGSGYNNWRIRVESQFDVDVSAFIRTPTGFMTQVDAVVPNINKLNHTVPIFNPASNINQVSKLRLINLSNSKNTFSIKGIDDEGTEFSSESLIELGPNQSIILTSQEIENGGDFFGEGIGNGKGKWQLLVTSSARAVIMSLLESPTGELSNLSNLGTEETNPYNVTCLDIDGASLFSDENEPVFLGFFGNNFATNSVNNEFGNYGSNYSQRSIRNELGNYGSQTSQYSHANTIAMAPPYVVSEGVTLFRLTSNLSFIDGISLSTIDNACNFYSSNKERSFARSK